MPRQPVVRIAHLSNPLSWSAAVLSSAMGLLSLSACDGGIDDGAVTPVSEHHAALSVQQGMTLQGMTLQGMTLQGMTLQGMTLQGTTLQGMTLQGTALGELGLGPERPVVLGNGKLAGVVPGDVLQGTTATGGKLLIRFDSVEADRQDRAGEVHLYELSVLSDDTRTWENPCTPDPEGRRLATVVAGSWDETGAHVETPGTFSFACTSGVIAKCIRWGYKPWASVNGAPLAPYHQACTRMARADYCGDGTSHTRNGTLIDVYDRLELQTRSSGEDFFFEGAWTPSGAYCVSKERWFGLTPDGRQKTPPLQDLACARELQNISLLSLSTTDDCALKIQPQRVRDVVMWNRSQVNIAP